jgi:hypothetical protein
MGVKLKEIRFEDVDCIYLAQNTEQVNKPSGVIKIRNKLSYY